MRTAEAITIASIADTPQMGQGGGGEVQGRPVRLHSACLGSACRENVEGFLLEDFPLELQFGFRIGGLIAHNFYKTTWLGIKAKRFKAALDPHYLAKHLVIQ